MSKGLLNNIQIPNTLTWGSQRLLIGCTGPQLCTGPLAPARLRMASRLELKLLQVYIHDFPLHPGSFWASTTDKQLMETQRKFSGVKFKHCVLIHCTAQALKILGTTLQTIIIIIFKIQEWEAQLYICSELFRVVSLQTT